METVYIIKWLPTGEAIGTHAYTDYGEAMKKAEKNNKARKWYHRMHTNACFVVQTFQVKAGG